jgi:hypothetical protein
MDNPLDTGNIGFTRHRTKTKLNYKKNITQKTKKMSNTNLPPKTGVNPGAHKG